jgi:hypothetical protein
MSVVNVKVQYIRPLGFVNLREWMADPNNVYVGRAGVVFIDGRRFPETASVFCNPFKIGKDGTRDEVIEKYRRFMKDKLDANSLLREKLVAMEGKNLGCWCAPEPCHGNVLLELIKVYKNGIVCNNCKSFEEKSFMKKCESCEFIICGNCAYNYDVSECCEKCEWNDLPNPESKYGLCDWCEVYKVCVYKCENCEIILCTDCIYGDDVTPEGILANWQCCNEPVYNGINFKK